MLWLRSLQQLTWEGRTWSSLCTGGSTAGLQEPSEALIVFDVMLVLSVYMEALLF